jgi:CHAT domain-containing protein
MLRGLVGAIIVACSWASASADELRSLDAAANRAFFEKRFEEALRLSSIALEKAAGAGQQTDVVSTFLARRAVSLERMGDYKAAAEAYSTLLNDYETRYGKGSINSAFAIEALARVLLKLDQVERAEAMFKQVFQIRSKMIVDGFDAFATTHSSNLASVKLARQDWRGALDIYNDTISLISAQGRIPTSDSPFMNVDPSNSQTFSGLSRAAWELYLREGDAGKLMTRAFEGYQWKWQTEAADALRKARGRDRSPTPIDVRSAQDHDSKTKQLARAIDQLDEEWIEKRESDPAYQALWQKRMQALPSTDEAIGMMTEMVADSAAAAKISTELTEGLQKCEAEPDFAACRQKLQHLEKQLESYTAREKSRIKRDAPVLATDEAIAAQLRDIEKQLDGYQEYQGRRQELAIELDRLSQLDGAGAGSPQNLPPQDIQSLPPQDAVDAPFAPLSIEDARRYLQPDEALITIQLGEDDGYIWIVTPDKDRWSRLSLDLRTATKLVAALRCGLDGEEWEGLRARSCESLLGVPLPEKSAPLPFSLSKSFELYQALFGQQRDLLSGKRLLIVASGPLTILPFHILVTEQPSTDLPKSFAGYREVPWLVRSHAVTILPTVASLKDLRDQRQSSEANEPYLGIGDPVLEGNESCGQGPAPTVCVANSAATSGEGQVASAARVRPTRNSPGFLDVYAEEEGKDGVAERVRKLCPLPDSRFELACTAQTLGSGPNALLLGSAATEANLARLNQSGELARYRIVHFATHGLLSGDVETMTESKGEPALVLTPSPDSAGTTDDGLLTASEIMGLRLNADWVVLSACNTAAGDHSEAEALSGLARAFFHAGGRTLLVSHWPVYSDAAVQITTKAFAELGASQRIGGAEAIRRSLISLMDDASESDNAHPSVWGPFDLIGEGAAGMASSGTEK